MEAKKSYKTFRYQNDLSWKSGLRGTVVSPGKHEIVVGSPPEFKGEEGLWSPEELLVAALNTCLMLTFLAYAKHKGLEIASYESHAEGLLENVDGKYRVTQIAVEPRVALKTEGDFERAGKIMASAKEGCFISNSITATVKLTPQFRVA
jgi:organic hydroperoxide reductase OsmC/OhrA